MLRFVVAAAASAWLVGAQDTESTNGFHPHAAFAFIRTGERTPLIQSGSSVLTALGANQMYSLGENFRIRYIEGDSGALGVEHIANMSQNFLNNDQIMVQTLDTPFLMSSAQAFMQGLYPPHGVSNGSGDATGLLADGTVLDFPLNGYQYANIQTSGYSDPASIAVDGFSACYLAQRDAMRYFSTEQFTSTKSASDEFYDSIPRDWFQGQFGDGDM